jgi:hypothetical protein
MAAAAATVPASSILWCDEELFGKVEAGLGKIDSRLKFRINPALADCFRAGVVDRVAVLRFSNTAIVVDETIQECDDDRLKHGQVTDVMRRVLRDLALPRLQEGLRELPRNDFLLFNLGRIYHLLDEEELQLKYYSLFEPGVWLLSYLKYIEFNFRKTVLICQELRKKFPGISFYFIEQKLLDRIEREIIDKDGILISSVLTYLVLADHHPEKALRILKMVETGCGIKVRNQLCRTLARSWPQRYTLKKAEKPLV